MFIPLVPEGPGKIKHRKHQNQQPNTFIQHVEENMERKLKVTRNLLCEKKKKISEIDSSIKILLQHE